MKRNFEEVLKIISELPSKSDAVIASEIQQFQNWIWNDQVIASEVQLEILADLAADLEYFDPEEKESPFFGRERLLKEISEALGKLR